MSNDEQFTRMADRIKHNADATFGGACVIVPPGDGKPIELLLLDATGDEAQFYATIMTRLQMAVSEIEARKRQGLAFGR